MMSRLLWLALVVTLLGTAACGGDGGGGSTSTGDAGGAGTGGDDDGGSGGKGGKGGKGGDGGQGDADGGGSDGGGSSGTGGGDKDGSTDIDASLTDGEIPDADFGVDVQPPDFDECTDIEPTDDEVTAMQQGGAMPTAAGGTIADGVYVLTAFDVYSPGTANSTVLRRLVNFDGNDMTVVYFDGSGPQHDNVGTFTTSGSMLTFSIDCPGEVTAMLSYSATATTFTLFDTGASTVATYTKQ